MSKKDIEKKLTKLALTHLFSEGRIELTSGKKLTRAFVGEKLGCSGAHIGGVASGRNWTPDIRKGIAVTFGYTDDQLLDLGQHILEGKAPKEWKPCETFDMCSSDTHSRVEKPKACVTSIDTNRHMQDISAWINTQDEPEEMWSWVKTELKYKFSDFADFLKKRSRDNIQDTTIQSSEVG